MPALVSSAMNSRRKVLSSEDKGAFRTAHKEEIEKYEDALNCLKVASPDGTFPPMKELKVEKSRLSHQRDQQRAALRTLARHRKQMRVITGNVKAILGESALSLDGRQQQI